MGVLYYKGRILNGKFTGRSLRYIFSDQSARLFPALQRRWLLPVEGRPIAEAASADVPLPSVLVDTPLPACYAKLGVNFPSPLQQTWHIYTLEDVVVTGWAGAMIKDGLLLTIRPQHNWVSALRARPHRLRKLPASRQYFNLMAPIPARGHMFHWLFDSILPLVAFLESGGSAAGLGLIVNAVQSELQRLTVDLLKHRYGIAAIEPVAEGEAVFVPQGQAAVPLHFLPRGLQSPLGLALLDEIGRFIAQGAACDDSPKRIYVSRSDARLRRVSNEDRILPVLKARGFTRVTLAGMPLARQVALFLNAEAVAGPHGAGLAHIAWCKPGTKVREFFPSPNRAGRQVKNASIDFWLITQQRGLEHRCYLAGPVERADAFAIPPDLLNQALDA